MNKRNEAQINAKMLFDEEINKERPHYQREKSEHFLSRKKVRGLRVRYHGIRNFQGITLNSFDMLLRKLQGMQLLWEGVKVLRRGWREPIIQIEYAADCKPKRFSYEVYLMIHRLIPAAWVGVAPTEGITDKLEEQGHQELAQWIRDHSPVATANVTLLLFVLHRMVHDGIYHDTTAHRFDADPNKGYVVSYFKPESKHEEDEEVPGTCPANQDR